jgi:glycosyltransferase
MKISIITASYNNVDSIEATIKSVLSQTYPDIEYIVVDGGSTDGTMDIVRKQGKAIARWVSEPDGGIYHALNKGLGLATGDVVGFLHADDMLHDYFVINNVMRIFQEQGCHAVYGDLVYVARNDVNNILRFWKSCCFEPKLLKKGWMPPHPTLFLHKSVYDKYGNFNTDLQIAADYDIILRFFSQPDFVSVYLPYIMVRMRMGGVSNKGLSNLWRKSQEDYKAMRFNKIGGVKSLIWKNLSKLSQFRLFKKVKSEDGDE